MSKIVSPSTNVWLLLHTLRYTNLEISIPAVDQHTTHYLIHHCKVGQAHFGGLSFLVGSSQTGPEPVDSPAMVQDTIWGYMRLVI